MSKNFKWNKTHPLPPSLLEKRGNAGVSFCLQTILPLSSIIIADQFSKFLITKWFLVSNSQTLKEIIPGFLEIAYVQNPGIAFGIPLGGLIFNIIISIVLTALAVLILNKNLNSTFNIQHSTFTLVLILAGGIGNLIDRFRLGYVVDFISFEFWPAFNIADMAISVGTIAFLYINFLKKEK